MIIIPIKTLVFKIKNEVNVLSFSVLYPLILLVSYPGNLEIIMPFY